MKDLEQPFDRQSSPVQGSQPRGGVWQDGSELRLSSQGCEVRVPALSFMCVLGQTTYGIPLLCLAAILRDQLDKFMCAEQ